MPQKNDTVLILDADILAYQVALGIEEITDFGEDPESDSGMIVLSADGDAGRQQMDNEIEWLLRELNADLMVFPMTCNEHNFRKDVLSSYKSNRAATFRPIALKSMRKHISEKPEAYSKYSLEGDDICGILATSEKALRYKNKIIISIDKDLKTIPNSTILNLNLYKELRKKGSKDPFKAALRSYTEDEANYYWLTQTLTGDTTDGYKGCPQVGAKSALKILGDPKDPDFKFDLKTAWEAVVAAFEKAKLTEEDALVQARVARILRAEDYDFKKKEVILWTPDF